MACIYSYHIYWYQCIDNSVFLNTDIKVSITPSVYKSNTLLHVVEYTQKIPLKIKKASLKSKNPCYSVSDRRCWYYIELIADHWGVCFFFHAYKEKKSFFFLLVIQNWFQSSISGSMSSYNITTVAVHLASPVSIVNASFSLCWHQLTQAWHRLNGLNLGSVYEFVYKITGFV